MKTERKKQLVDIRHLSGSRRSCQRAHRLLPPLPIETVGVVHEIEAELQGKVCLP
jgi:hypothetical protein